MTIPLHFTLWQESDASRPCLCFVNTLAALVVTKQHTWTFQTTPALTAPGNGLGCKLHNDQHFRKRESCPGEGYGLSVKAGSFLAEPPSPWAPCRGSTGPGVLLGGLFLRRGPAETEPVSPARPTCTRARCWEGVAVLPRCLHWTALLFPLPPRPVIPDLGPLPPRDCLPGNGVDGKGPHPESD